MSSRQKFKTSEPPSSEEVAFLRALAESPNDLTLRLVFADWLEEHGDPRGELLRLTHILTQSVEAPDRATLEARLRALLEQGARPIGPFWTNSIGMKLAWIPPGTFMMGSPPTEAERGDDETQHRVTLTKGFALGIHQVTQAQWQAIMGKNPGHFRGDTLPVETIAWFDAVTFCNKLSDKEGKQPYYRIEDKQITILGGTGYRLPTEAEWEYACRAGTTTPFHFGQTISTELANYNGEYIYGSGAKGEYRQKTTPVGSFPANAWGLFDTHGNVWEWCWDWYEDYPAREVVDPQGPDTESYRVLRGGSWNFHPALCRSAYRDWFTPGYRDFTYGFRLCSCLD